MRGLMKLAGVARFDCIGSTQEFACYMAGLASPGDHTCGWTTSTLHSHLAWRYWFRWGCGASSTTSVIADLAGSHIPYPRSTGPDHAAIHPIRRGAPDQKGCNAYGSGAPPPTTSPTADTPSRHTTTGSIGRRHTTSTHSHRFRARAVAPVRSRYTRSVATHPIRRGVMPTDRVHRLPQQAQPRAIPPHRPLPSASDAATWPRHAHPGSEREALHQLRSVTPPPSWCNTQLSGVTPLSNKYQCGDMPRLSSQNTRQRSSAATEETVHHRELHADSNTTPHHCHFRKLNSRKIITPFHTKPRKDQGGTFQPIIETSTIETYAHRTSVRKPTDYSAAQQRPKVTSLARN